MYQTLPADFFILRRPLLPINAYLDVQARLEAGASLDSILRTVYQAPACRDALYYASPALHQQLLGWLDGQVTVSADFLLTLYRYFVRMTTRATPFGLFAGVMHGHWCEPTGPQTDDSVHPVVRLSTDYLCHLVATLVQQSAIRRQLRYTPNATLWRAGEVYRYIGYTEEAGQLTYYQQETPAHTVLDEVLDSARAGASIAQLSQAIAESGIDPLEADAYVAALIDNYMLVADLGVSLTGADPLDVLIDRLARFTNGHDLVQPLQAVRQRLRNGQVAGYADIDTLMQPFGLAMPASVQCDTLFRGTTAHLPPSLNHQINRLLPLLTKLARPRDMPLLQAFRERFYERFGDQRVPLLLALDPDSGIGYGQEQAMPSPWLTNLSRASPQPATGLPATLPADTLFRLYAAALHQSEPVIHLAADQLDSLLPGHPSNAMPYHAFLMLALVNQPHSADPLLVLKALGGPSVATLAGRFAHLDPEMQADLQALTHREQQAYPDAVLAELVHLPESRTGNLLRRPQLRSYEIPLLTASTLPLDNQLSLSDLSISVRQGQQILLHAKSLPLPVLPRLSTAHHVHMGSLVHYRFLYDLQHQTESVQAVWQWGQLAAMPFLPRVQCGNLVLSRARWLLRPADLTTDGQWVNWKAQYHLPLHVVLGDGDNELAINTATPLGLSLLRQAMKQAGQVTLFEWPGLTNPAPQAPHWTRELIVPLQADQPRTAQAGAVITPALNQVAQRRFLPGSEWVYLKVYAGAVVIDALLENWVGELVAKLSRRQLIRGWFFVRYADPETHLRLRFCCTAGKVGTVFRMVNQWAARQAEADERIYRVQFDTYERELERYGHTTIAACEAWFGQDSASVLRLIALASQSASEWERLRLGCLAVYTLLTAWQKTLPDQIALVERWRDGFLTEFKADKATRQGLNDQFRHHKAYLYPPQPNQEIALADVLAHYRQQAEAFFAQHQILTDAATTEALLPHLTHMFINRLFADDQRQHELVVYYYLHKLLKSWWLSTGK